MWVDTHISLHMYILYMWTYLSIHVHVSPFVDRVGQLPSALQGLQALLQAYMGEVPSFKLMPVDADYDWCRFKWEELSSLMPARGRPGDAEEVIDSQEPEANTTRRPRFDRMSAAYQEEYCRNKQLAAQQREEDDRALQATMADSTTMPVAPHPSRPKLKVGVTHATLDGGHQRHEGIAVDVGETFSLTIHFQIQDDQPEDGAVDTKAATEATQLYEERLQEDHDEPRPRTPTTLPPSPTRRETAHGDEPRQQEEMGKRDTPKEAPGRDEHRPQGMQQGEERLHGPEEEAERRKDAAEHSTKPIFLSCSALPPTAPRHPHQKTLHKKGGVFRSPAKRFMSAEMDEKMDEKGLEEEYDDSGAQRYKGLPLSGKSKRKHPTEETDLTTERTTETDLTTKRTTVTQQGRTMPQAELREHPTQVDDGDQSS